MKSLLFLVLLAATAVPVAREDEGPRGPKPPAFEVPKGWQPEKPGPLASARFRIGEGDGPATVTVTALAKGAIGRGGLVANVNRWRQQVGLPPVGDAEARELVRPARVGGLAAHLVDVTGPDAPGKPAQRNVVAFVEQGERTWFFRLAGPSRLVGEQRAAFDRFLKSVRFDDPGKK